MTLYHLNMNISLNEKNSIKNLGDLSSIVVIVVPFVIIAMTFGQRALAITDLCVYIPAFFVTVVLVFRLGYRRQLG